MTTPINTPNEEITPAAEKVEGQEPVVTDEEATPEVAEAEVAVEEEPLAEELPADVLRKKVTEANAEAANYRTKLREAEDALKNAKSPEEVAAIIKGLTDERETTEHSLVVENVSLKAKLPEDLTALLADYSVGKTREQIEAHALVLAKYAPVTEDEDVTPRGGLRPQTEEGAFDPVATVQKNRRRR